MCNPFARAIRIVLEAADRGGYRAALIGGGYFSLLEADHDLERLLTEAQAPVANRETTPAARVPHDIDEFLRFLEQVEEIGGKIRKPRTISVGNRFVL